MVGQRLALEQVAYLEEALQLPLVLLVLPTEAVVAVVAESLQIIKPLVAMVGLVFSSYVMLIHTMPLHRPQALRHTSSPVDTISTPSQVQGASRSDGSLCAA